jgi:predicted house-cleaning noncanonical NTP pyrophosphatase (MazG superfamily)
VSVKNDLIKQLEEEEEVLQDYEQQELQNTIDVVTNRAKSLNMRSHVAGNCSTSNDRVIF